MKKYLARYSSEGECIYCQPYNGKVLNSGDEVLDYGQGRVSDYHKPEYINSYKLQAIKNKAKELLSKNNYIFGLSTGWQKDDEYKTWCQDIISLSNSFDDTTITNNQIIFPLDPWGEQEVLDL